MMKSKKNLILKIAIAIFTFGIGITTLFNVKVNADTSNIIELGTMINPNDIITMSDVDGDSKEYGTENESSQPEQPSEINGIYEGTRELTQRLIFGDNELTTWQEGVLDTISILVTISVYLLPFILFFAIVKILLKP